MPAEKIDVRKIGNKLLVDNLILEIQQRAGNRGSVLQVMGGSSNSTLYSLRAEILRRLNSSEER